MRKYLYCEAGFVEESQWLPNCWVNVVNPDTNDFEFLTQTLKVPESFLNDIADTDERPRTDTEGNWLLTILRIPVQNKQSDNFPFSTVPIGIITNDDVIVSVCYHDTDMLPDFIEHTRKKGIEVRNKLDLILRLIYSSAVWFLKYLKQINVDINAAEKELEKSIRNEDLLRLMKLQKTLVYFNTSIRGNEVMIGKLQTIFQDTGYLDKELVEDCIQDVFIKIIQNHTHLMPTLSVKGYLLKALRNKILDCFEKERITEPIEEYEEAFAEEVLMGEAEEGNERTELLLRSFSELSPRQREILYLYYVNELTHEDIARLLGINYQSSKNLLFRSLSKLKKIFLKMDILKLKLLKPFAEKTCIS